MRTYCFFFFSSRRRHTRLQGDWSSDVCSSDLGDGWHATSKSPAELAASLDRLRAMADAARRPFETIALSIRVALRHALTRSEEHTSELQSPCNLVCRLLLETKKNNNITTR